MIESQWIWSNAPKYRAQKNQSHAPSVGGKSATGCDKRSHFKKSFVLFEAAAFPQPACRCSREETRAKRSERNEDGSEGGEKKKRPEGGCGQLKICQRLYNSEIGAKRTVKKPARRAQCINNFMMAWLR